MPLNIQLYKIVLLTCAFLFLKNIKIHAQFIENPSLEGFPAESQMPSNWSTCAFNSNPDTQPGFWGVSKAPSHGNSYVSLVVRGNLGPNANRKEDIQTVLSTSLESGKCYELSFDIAVSENFGHDSWSGWVSYNRGAKLSVWGGSQSCNRDELLFGIDSVSHYVWKTYTVPIIPTSTVLNYLIFQADYASTDTYFGNVLIDNIVLKELNEVVIKMDTSVDFDSKITLNGSKGIAYQWPDNRGLSCIDCSNPELTVTQNDMYQVTITHSNGCQKVEEFRIFVPLNIPNIITPNGDGINDSFQVLGNLGTLVFSVYNRWGVLVFESTNYRNNWDAVSSTGKRLPVGAYLYQLTFQKTNKTYKGWVQVVY
jgi:gliding motility-associated-like protein